MEKEQRVLQVLALAKKAGKAASGGYQVEQAVKGGKALMVFLAADASDNTKKQVRNMCTYYRVPLICLADKEKLGHSVGCESRSSAAILDQSFIKAVNKALGREIGVGSEGVNGKNENI